MSNVQDPLLEGARLPPDARPISKVPSCTLASRRAMIEENDSKAQQKPSIIASIATLLLTLPALLGTCCWPVLIAGVLGITATAEAKVFSHTFSLVLTAVVLTNLTQFVWQKASVKPGVHSHWQRYGPTYLLALATPLILADQVRHALQDANIWPQPSSSMYQDDCDTSAFNWCLTTVGWIFTIFATYTGFSLMVISVLWQTRFITKLKRAYYGEDCNCEV